MSQRDRSHNVAQVGHKLAVIFLPQPPESWDDWCETTHTVSLAILSSLNVYWLTHSRVCQTLACILAAGDTSGDRCPLKTDSMLQSLFLLEAVVNEAVL